MPLPSLESVEPLPGPFEILDMPGNSSREFTVVKHQVGRMTIHPRDGRPAREIVALRCFVTSEDKPLYPDYYDLTAQTLVPQLLPYLDAAKGEPVRFRITKFGQGPTARFSVVKQA